MFGGADLTAKGRKLFKKTTPPALGARAYLVDPIRRSIVDITGITDGPAVFGPSTKIVQYTYIVELRDLPKEWYEAYAAEHGTTPGKELSDDVEALRAHPPSSEALLRLYDDGWRVEEVELKSGL